MSQKAHAASRPKRRATLSARRELWLRGGGSSEDEPSPPVNLFESPPTDTFSFPSILGESCIIVEGKRVTSEICGFQLQQGSDKT